MEPSKSHSDSIADQAARAGAVRGEKPFRRTAPSLRMRGPLGATLERVCVFERDFHQPLGLEGLLRQRHAAVKYLRVPFDAVTLEVEPADAIEGDARAFGLRTRGLEAEAITGVTGLPGKHGIVEFPTKLAPSLGKMRQLLLDRRATAAWSEEVVVVGALRREQIGESVAITGGRRRGKAVDEFCKSHGGSLPCLLLTGRAC